MVMASGSTSATWTPAGLPPRAPSEKAAMRRTEAIRDVVVCMAISTKR
ncbi:Uncharacterised protein [Bordetella pertussis]|nr:Uncharacterised protein [Bordetella pertussis]CFW50569.1 Uncharacterised protein [Bordetella pertussis]